MTPVVMWVLVGASLVVGLFALWHSIRGYRISNPLLYGVGIVELLAIGSLVGGSFALARSEGEVSAVLFLSYLVTMVVVPPAAVAWGIGEKSRWGTGIIVVGMLTVTALALRVEQIWRTGG